MISWCRQFGYSFNNGLVDTILICCDRESCKVGLWLSELPFGDVQCNVLLCASLLKLPDVVCVLSNLSIVNGDVINDVAVSSKASEGLMGL